MLFIMFCEFYYLLFWATVGWYLAANVLPQLAVDALPVVGVVAVAFFAAVLVYFRTSLFGEGALRDRPAFTAFRQAGLSRYLVIMAFRSPALMAAVLVYSQAAGLFGLDVPFRDMQAILPLIFFGTFIPGPFRAVAISLWTVLMPEADPARVAAFGFVQHNFFVLFNAAIGLVFLRRANRELFGNAGSTEGAAGA